MTYTLYGIPNCDTIKKARKWLTERQIDFTFHDYKKLGITSEKLLHWLTQVDKDKLVNKAGTTYRKLSDSEKESISSDERAIALLIANPSMIKRPVLEKEGKVIAVGFKPENYHNLLTQ
ncbi:MAG: ArsC family reductase [Bacteroidia bacterium]|nr:ArsC family reductase [Bacteroidia bacterium]